MDSNPALSHRRTIERLRSRVLASLAAPATQSPILQPVPVETLMAMPGLAGEIATVAMALRVGGVDDQTQRAMWVKLGNLAVQVGVKERTLLETYDETDVTTPGGVPYHGEQF